MGDRPEKGNENLLTRSLNHRGASVFLVAMILLLAACGGVPKAPVPSHSATSESGVEDDTAPADEDGDGSSTDSDCDDADPTRFPGADEVCNGVDDDCDGSADEEALDAPSWYADADADGFGAGAPAAQCEAPLGWVVDSSDCDDLDPDVFPGHVELCATSVDDDCDGFVNEADAFDAVAWAPDVDGDRFGDADAAVVGCDAVSGWIPNATDCDDDDPALHPGVRDVCNDGIDQDCDGTARTCPYVGDVETGAAGSSTYVGSVRVFSGTTLAVGGDDHAPDATWDGEGGMFGYYVDVSGDADGDGLNDLVSTAYRYGSGTFDQPGRVYVFYSPGLGSGAAVDADVTLDGDAHTNGGGGGHWAGDINADGYSDLLVTNPDLEVDSGATGAVFLFYGPVSGDLTRNTDADATLQAPPGAGGFGATLYQPVDYGVGDVDGDGADDFIVPAIDSDSVWLFHGGL